ncbi:MAG: Amuc_1100 family pilus-like protein [Chthoniobacterales bacterium]
MNWFKDNPFVGALVASTAILTLAGLYFAYTQHTAFIEQTDAFASNNSSLASLQSAKPFPNEANLKAAEEEAESAAKILGDLAAEVARQSTPLDPTLTPRDFQDKLSAAAATAEKAAANAEVGLPEDFYLGFSAYKAQPPPEAAAPVLGQQLETIANVTGLLLKSGIRQLVGIERAPLRPEEPETDEGENKPTSAQLAAVQLAPFDVEFVAEQSAFRGALSAIITAQPVVLVRLVSVTNSSPSPPAKGSADATQETAQPAATTEGSGQIPVAFGKETLNVKLRLASVSVTPAAAKE